MCHWRQNRLTLNYLKYFLHCTLKFFIHCIVHQRSLLKPQVLTKNKFQLHTCYIMHMKWGFIAPWNHGKSIHLFIPYIHPYSFRPTSVYKFWFTREAQPFLCWDSTTCEITCLFTMVYKNFVRLQFFAYPTVSRVENRCNKKHVPYTHCASCWAKVKHAELSFN